MAIVHEHVSNAVYEVALAPQVATDNTALVGRVIDMQGFQSVTFVVLTGDLADADATFAVTMVHGNAANLSDGAAVDTASLVGTLAGAGFDFAADTSTRKVGYTPGKGAGRRYVRITVTPTGNAGNAPIAVVAVKLPLLTPA